MRGVRVVVSGRVQGVGYRAFARRRASELGLAGWVTNLPGGEVRLQAAGPEPALRELVVALRAGPTGARVAGFAEEWFDVAEPGTGFEITG